MKLNTIQEAIADIKLGKMVIVVDDEDRENEGDFVMAAEFATPEAINFMTQYGRGIVCAPITKERANQLDLPLMVKSNTTIHETPFTISIDLKKNQSTGISCQDRSDTIMALTDEKTTPDDFLRPGHIFPLVARDGGVLVRNGHTEAAVDLAKMAGLYPAGIICEIMKEDGEMARLPDLLVMAEKWDMKIITIADLVKIKRGQIEWKAQCQLPTSYGPFQMTTFDQIGEISGTTGGSHFVLTHGNPETSHDVLVRIHSECLTGDLLGSQRCDCGHQLQSSLQQIQESDCGVLIYLRQEGRGIGLNEKIKAYSLQENGLDTVEANIELGHGPDLRSYEMAIEVLKKLNVSNMTLLTNNPQKMIALEKDPFFQSIKVKNIHITPNIHNQAYMHTKREKFGHHFHLN